MQVFYIKRGDTSPAIQFALEPTDVDLTAAVVQFQMKNTVTGALVTDAPGLVIVETGTPTVGYRWQASDTLNSGKFIAEFRVTYADGTIETFPNNGFITIQIAADVR